MSSTRAWVYVLSVLCLLIALGKSEKTCYSYEREPYLRFSTKTSYRIARNLRNQSQVPGCSAVSVWALIRHGTRNPNEENMNDLGQLLPLRDIILDNHLKLLRGGMCDEDLEALKNWNLRYKASEANQLVPEGASDLKILGKSFEFSYPTLYRSLSDDNIVVKHTALKRTKDSARAFLEGLGYASVMDLPTTDADQLLMPDFNCTVYEESEDSDMAKAESVLFRNSPEVIELSADVSTRLGFEYNVSLSVIKLIYDMCRYDKAIFYSETSPWCAAFTTENLQTLEYLQDLKFYYNSGYGNPLAAKMGCPLVKDLINRFQDIVDANGTGSHPKLVAYFAHSSTIRFLLTRLGLAQDDKPITAFMSRAQRQNRQWQTSSISPFTANIQAVLYKCSHSDGDDFKVMFFVNEYMVEYTGCKVGLCDWTYIKRIFHDTIQPSSCNLKFCSGDNSASTSYLSAFAAVLALTAYLTV